jgi:hypothetical protein
VREEYSVLPDITVHDCAAGARPPAPPGCGPHAGTPGAKRVRQAWPTMREVLGAALRRRVEQRAARQSAPSRSLVGHLCEQCLDAPATLLQPAPWGGEMGVCTPCAETVEEMGASVNEPRSLQWPAEGTKGAL